MWIFGYGSLLWKVDFPYERKLVGYINGYVRRFYQHSIDHRGIPEKPGRVVTLLPGTEVDIVWGIAYEISNKEKDNVLEHLDFREKNGYVKANVLFHPGKEDEGAEKPFPLTLYVATEQNVSFAGEAPIEDIAKQVIECEGPSGTNKEYVYRLASAMRIIAPGVCDDHLYNIEAALKKLDRSDPAQLDQI